MKIVHHQTSPTDVAIYVVYYRLKFEPMPTVYEAIHIGADVHVKLQYKG